MFNKLLEITEQRANEADKIFLSELNEFALNFKEIVDKVSLEADIPNLVNFYEKINQITSQVAYINDTRSIDNPELLQAVMKDIHSIKNAFTKIITQKSKDAQKNYSDIEAQVLEMGMEFNAENKEFDLGPIAKEAEFLGKKSEASYPPEISAALRAKKALTELKSAVDQIISADVNLPLITARKSFDDILHKNLRFVNLSTRKELVPGHQKKNSRLIQTYLDKHFTDVDTNINKYINAYISWVKLKESRENLDGLYLSLNTKWQNIHVSRNQFLTRNSLDKITQSWRDPEYSGAVILKSMLKKELGLPASLIKQATGLEKRLAFLEEELVKPNSDLIKFQIDGISSQLILHTIRNNIENIQVAQLGILNHVMNKNFLHKLTTEPAQTKIQFQELIDQNAIKLAEAIKHTDAWLVKIEALKKNDLKLPTLAPLTSSPSNSRSSVSSIYRRFFTHDSPQSIANSIKTSIPEPMPVMDSPAQAKKSILPSIFRPTADNTISKIAGTISEKKASSAILRRNAISPRTVKFNEEKESEDTLPNLISETKTPRPRR